MQELLDPRGDRTCGICGQLHPRSGFYSYGEDEDGRGRLICIRCLCEMVAKAPASVQHPLKGDPDERPLPRHPKRVRDAMPPPTPDPPSPEPPYPRYDSGANE